MLGMEIKTSVVNGETVMKVVGCLDTAATPQFAAAIAQAPADRVLVVDMTDLEFIASSALRQLVAAKKRQPAGGVDIVLAGMNEVVRDVFDVTGLDEVFTIR